VDLTIELGGGSVQVDRIHTLDENDKRVMTSPDITVLGLWAVIMDIDERCVHADQGIAIRSGIGAVGLSVRRGCNLYGCERTLKGHYNQCWILHLRTLYFSQKFQVKNIKILVKDHMYQTTDWYPTIVSRTCNSDWREGRGRAR
jgi:hypothetical protein